MKELCEDVVREVAIELVERGLSTTEIARFFNTTTDIIRNLMKEGA